MEANQSQEVPGKPAAKKSPNEAAPGIGQLFTSLGERIRSGELKARLHYFLFRQTQQARLSDSLFSRYKRRLREDWQKWAGISTGITGLIMLLSPERFWLWQLPLVFILILLAPAVFELPATLNSLFGHTEQQHLVGQIITLTQPIVDGRGQATLDGKEWSISGPDCAMGDNVKIVTLDAKTLYVMPANTSGSLSEP